jgi:hypothetical protein
MRPEKQGQQSNEMRAIIDSGRLPLPAQVTDKPAKDAKELAKLNEDAAQTGAQPSGKAQGGEAVTTGVGAADLRNTGTQAASTGSKGASSGTAKK